MKVKIFTYPDGKQAYGSGDINIVLNKQDPSKIEEVEMGDGGQMLLDNPDKYEAVKIKGKYHIKEKKNKK